MPLVLYQTYTEPSAVAAFTDGVPVFPEWEKCFASFGGEILAFFELGATTNETHFESAFQIRWQPGRIPRMLREARQAIIHGLVKGSSEREFVYIGIIRQNWSVESGKMADSFVCFQLETPLTKQIAWNLGIRSKWNFRLISESSEEGERRHFCCRQSIQNEDEFEQMLALAQEKEDIELFLKDFFTLHEVNVNMNAKDQAVVTYMKEDDSDGEEPFFVYSRNRSTIYEGEVDFFDCSPVGCFVPIPIPSANVVMRSEAMAAIREFYKTGKQPRCVAFGDYG